MNVYELIQELRKYNPNAEVKICLPNHRVSIESIRQHKKNEIDIDTDVDEDSMNAWYGIEETQ